MKLQALEQVGVQTLGSSTPEQPDQQRYRHGNDEAGHDRKVKAEAFPEDMNVTRQATEWQLAQPGPRKTYHEDRHA
jgi:hypothetical protein